ncbi:MAG TPA: RDD family protein [Terriglobales bacterium]|nr:RDD family protein [Terriglobales bacterium]
MPDGRRHAHLESDAGRGPSPLHAEARLIDPEAGDTSEQQFAARMEGHGESWRPEFGVEHSRAAGASAGERASLDEVVPEPAEGTALVNEPALTPVQPELLTETSHQSWRTEVSERLHRYRARRRPRGPRYPSLRLKFETPDATWAAPCRTSEPPASPQRTQSSTAPVLANRQAVAVERVEIATEPALGGRDRTTAPAAPERVEPQSGETTAKIIEFPRSMYAPPLPWNELADPVVDRPRILEAPEVVPPPPALGGITIEAARVREPERRLGIDMPLQSAPLERRLLAAAIDAALVVLAGVGFGASFYRIAGIRPPLAQIIAFGAGLLGSLWAAYQYLLIVYSGNTPGLRAMKLQLQRFDGSFPSRRLRRWRVLGSMLSGISLGMGYAWQFLDEDNLCWHERVTKTYLAPEKQS